MLAAGIGLNVIVFTVTNTVLFKGFPGVRDNDRLLYITARRSGGASYPDFEDWRAQARSFQGMALVHGVQQTYSDADGFPEIVLRHRGDGEHVQPRRAEADPRPQLHQRR